MFQFLEHLNTYLLNKPAILLLFIEVSKTYVHTHTDDCMRIFIWVLFATTKNWKNKMFLYWGMVKQIVIQP